MPEWFKTGCLLLFWLLLASIALEIRAEFVTLCRETLLAGGRFMRGACASVRDLWRGEKILE